MEADRLDELLRSERAYDELIKAAVEEAIDLLASFIRDEDLPLCDRLEAAAILLRTAPFTELKCLEFDLGYMKRQSPESN
jgi:hypothetical protein